MNSHSVNIECWKLNGTNSKFTQIPDRVCKSEMSRSFIHSVEIYQVSISQIKFHKTTSQVVKIANTSSLSCLMSLHILSLCLIQFEHFHLSHVGWMRMPQRMRRFPIAVKILENCFSKDCLVVSFVVALMWNHIIKKPKTEFFYDLWFQFAFGPFTSHFLSIFFLSFLITA